MIGFDAGATAIARAERVNSAIKTSAINVDRSLSSFSVKYTKRLDKIFQETPSFMTIRRLLSQHLFDGRRGE